MVRGLQRSFDPHGGNPEPKICSKQGFPLKLPKNCMILKKSWEVGGPVLYEISELGKPEFSSHFSQGNIRILMQ